MAKTPEGKIKDQIKGVLKTYGLSYQMPVTGGYGTSGYPDFTICLSGLYLAIEAKADAKKKGPTQLQKLRMAEIRDSGGLTLVVDTYNVHMLEWFIHHAVKSVTEVDTFVEDCINTLIAYAKHYKLWYEELPRHE